LLGASVGEDREVTIGSKAARFRVIDIQ